MNEETAKYFIYVRKSTGGEERQARSIADQLAEIRALVKKEQLDVVGSFEEAQSAMTKGRPQFNDMLRRIEAGEADGVIAWHPDRLARNAYDGGQVIDLLDQGKIRDLKFCSFWFESTAQGKLMLNLAFGQSKYYSDSLSVNIRRGQRQKTLEGVWSWKAPLGYLNDPVSRTIVPDPVAAPLVKRAFDLYATGQYPLTALCDTMNAAGLRGMRGGTLTPGRYQHLLKNPFYYGLFRVNGELHEGAHEPLVTKKLADKVAEVMGRRSKPNGKRLKVSVYRGLFRCATCGSVITMETQKGVNYLRCTKRVMRDCPQRYAREDAITGQVADVLRSLSLPDDDADWMVREVEAERARGDGGVEDVRSRLKGDVRRVDAKLDRLTAAYLDAGAFSAAEFRTRKGDLLGIKRKLLDDLAARDREDADRFEPLIRFICGSKQLKYVAQAADPVLMRAQLETTGSNLLLDNGRLTWEPRGAWKTVVGQGDSGARVDARPKNAAPAAAKVAGFPVKWSAKDRVRVRRKSLGAIRPVFRDNPSWN